MMKKLFFLVLLTVIIFPPKGHGNENEIILAADQWCPYNCAPDTEKPGYIVEIAKIVFEEAGYRVIYRTTLWESAVKAARIGRYNGIIAATKVEGKGFVFPQEEVGVSSNDFFVAAGDSWRYKSVSSLETKRLGVIKGYDYGETINGYIAGAMEGRIQMVSWDNAVELNLKKLVNGRIDVLLDDRNVISYIAGEMGLGNKITYAGSNGKQQKLYVAFSPAVEKSKAYARIMDEGVLNLRKTGVLSNILSKYGLTDWR